MIFNSTVLIIIEESVASLDRVLISAQMSTAPQVPEDYYAGTVETTEAMFVTLCTNPMKHMLGMLNNAMGSYAPSLKVILQ